MRPADMRVLLTGATGGIGRAFAAELARHGAALLLTGRNDERLGAYVKVLRDRYGVDIEAVPADLGSPADRARLADAARAFGVNVLVNNAGVNAFGRFDAQQAADLERVIATNVTAPMLLTRALLPMLESQDEACVVNIGSAIGSIGMPGQAAYCASKFALHGFSEALRRELGNGPVRVVYVAPRSTDTTMNDAAMRDMNARTGVRSDTPERVAALVYAAVAGKRRERFVGWPERLFVKINALLPGLVDNAVRKQAGLLTPASSADHPITHLDGVKQ